MNDNHQAASMPQGAADLLEGLANQLKKTHETVVALLELFAGREVPLDRSDKTSGGDSVEGAAPKGEEEKDEDFPSFAKRAEGPTTALADAADAGTARRAPGVDARGGDEGLNLKQPKEPRYTVNPVQQSGRPVTPIGGGRREGRPRTPGAPQVMRRGGPPSQKYCNAA